MANTENDTVSIIDTTGGADGVLDNDDVVSVEMIAPPAVLTYLEDKMQVYVTNIPGWQWHLFL